MNKITLTVERTGNIFSIAGSEYKATFPDGSTETFWSPPWNDYEPEEEDANALLYAAQQYANKIKAVTDAARASRESEGDPIVTEIEANPPDKLLEI